MKRTIATLLILVTIFSMTLTPYANPAWNVTNTRYGSQSGDVSWSLGIASLLAIPTFGAASVWLGVASVIASEVSGPWTYYYIQQTRTSPDSYAYYFRTRWYRNANYTSQVGSTVDSPIYYITAKVPEVM